MAPGSNMDAGAEPTTASSDSQQPTNEQVPEESSTQITSVPASEPGLDEKSAGEDGEQLHNEPG